MIVNHVVERLGPGDGTPLPDPNEKYESGDGFVVSDETGSDDDDDGEDEGKRSDGTVKGTMIRAHHKGHLYPSRQLLHQRRGRDSFPQSFHLTAKGMRRHSRLMTIHRFPKKNQLRSV
jgi:hypothetical protein